MNCLSTSSQSLRMTLGNAKIAVAVWYLQLIIEIHVFALAGPILKQTHDLLRVRIKCMELQPTLIVACKQMNEIVFANE
jgi:hypothetical protein